MSTHAQSFPAKILLFGEYSILLGSSALSIPYHAYTAMLSFPGGEEIPTIHPQVASNHQLFEFYYFLVRQGDRFSQIMNLDQFHEELAKGLYLQSTIPSGYGLGSSGALVAAVYERFSYQFPSVKEISASEGIMKLKTIFSEMESFFHGKSSGFDPTVSFIRKPLLLKSNGMIVPASLPQAFSTGGAAIFLLDSGQPGKTASLVKQFLERFKPNGQISDEGKALTWMIDHLVNLFLDFSEDLFWELMRKLSRQQLEEFKPMIPESLTSIWVEGLQNELFYFKLCGSGGGGFLTGFTPDYQKATSFMQNRGYYPVPVRINDQ